jgi:hypothetical protein
MDSYKKCFEPSVSVEVMNAVAQMEERAESRHTSSKSPPAKRARKTTVIEKERKTTSKVNDKSLSGASDSISSPNCVKQYRAHIMKVMNIDDVQYRYILIVQDVYSNYIYLRPIMEANVHSYIHTLESNASKFMEVAMKSVFDDRKCEYLVTNKGLLFCSKKMLELYEAYDVKHLKSESILLVNKIWTLCKHYRVFDQRDSYSYYDILQEVAHMFNHLQSM